MNDEFEGMGGSYIINADGARELVSRTREPGDEPEPPTLTEVIAPPIVAEFHYPTDPNDAELVEK